MGTSSRLIPILLACLAAACAEDPVTPDGSIGAPPPVDARGPTDAAVDAPADAPVDAPVTPPSRYFEDVTEASGVTASREPTEAYLTLADRMGGGVCVLDVDGTAPLDLFFALRDGAGLAAGSRLFVGRGVLDYADETAARGLSDVGDALGCLAVDVDGDRDDDLLVTGVGGLRLFENSGGVFVDVSTRIDATYVPGVMYMSAAAGDVDGDGDLDFVVAGYLRYDASSAPPEGCDPLPCSADVRSYLPAANLLLIRAPDGSYVDRATALAPDLATSEPTLVVAIADIDGDSRPNIYVGNDLGFAVYDRVLAPVRGPGDGGPDAWVDVSDVVGLAYNGRGYGIDSMGWTMGDVDGNGFFDFAVTSFEDDPTSLFMCSGVGPCEERGVPSGFGARAESFRWGAGFFDLDLDGDLDLIEAAGHVFTDEEAAAVGFAAGEQQLPNLFVNDGAANFTAIDPREDDALGRALAGRGLAVVDLDDDGRLDVVIVSARGRPTLLHNVTERVGHYLRVSLVGRAPNAAGVGARVSVRTAERAFLRERVVGEGYLGNFDPRLHFGLPPGVGPVTVEVRWASGTETVASAVEVDRELVIRED